MNGNPMDEGAFERFHAETAEALWAYLRRLGRGLAGAEGRLRTSV